MTGAGVVLWAGLVMASGDPAPPVLQDPAAAAVHARSAPPLLRAEVLLLVGDPEAARAALDGLSRDDPRALRLRADTWVAEGDAQGAEPALAALEAHPRWAAHARQQRAYLALGRRDRLVGRVAMLTFVLCLAVLALGGARALLRFHPESALFAAAGVGAVLVAHGTAAQATPLVGLVAAATFFLVHAAAAARQRARPGPRGRLLLATLVLMGALGATLALGVQVGAGGLIRVLAASARAPN